jgi:uncharacterized lipoprotein YajG
MKGNKVLCILLFYVLSFLLITGCQKKRATQTPAPGVSTGTAVGVSTQTPSGEGW